MAIDHQAAPDAMRVSVGGLDGWRGADTLQAVLVTQEGDIAEVQVAQRGLSMVVVLAGSVTVRHTERGHLVIILEPTPKE